MFVSVQCPNCAARINVPEQRLGRTIRCPRCLGDVPTEADEPAEELEPVEEEPEPLPRRKLVERPERSTDSLDRPRKRKKKKKRSEAEEAARRWLIWVAVGGGGLGIGLVALLIWGLNSAFRSEPPPTIPAERWQPLEIPNRIKVLLPGFAARQQGPAAGGIQSVMYLCQADKDNVFGVGYSEGALPDAIRNMQLEAILNDSCEGALHNIRQMAGGKGVHELSRESVSIGPHKGKELVIEIQAREGATMIMRTFYHEASGRRYIAMCGGKNYEADQPNVKKFFESFQILDNGLPDPPPEEKKKEPADKKKGPAGPQGPALPKAAPPKEGPKK
jgi:predicted Zn finger-like uncharacterized protein